MTSRNLPPRTIMTLSDTRLVTFFNKMGDKIGEIDFSTDKIIFEGNMSSSAEVLFGFLRDILEPLYNKKNNE